MPKLMPKLMFLRAGELVGRASTPYMKPVRRLELDRSGGATEKCRKRRRDGQPPRRQQSRLKTRRKSVE